MATLNDRSRNRINYELNAIAKIEAAVAAGKGTKKSASVIAKKRELIAKIEAQIAARTAKAASKSSELSAEEAVEVSVEELVSSVENDDSTSVEVDPIAV